MQKKINIIKTFKNRTIKFSFFFKSLDKLKDGILLFLYKRKKLINYAIFFRTKKIN